MSKTFILWHDFPCFHKKHYLQSPCFFSLSKWLYRRVPVIKSGDWMLVSFNLATLRTEIYYIRRVSYCSLSLLCVSISLWVSKYEPWGYLGKRRILQVCILPWNQVRSWYQKILYCYHIDLFGCEWFGHHPSVLCCVW